MSKYLVQLTTFVEVEVDESKFTPEFMAEYNQNFQHFPDIAGHIRHLAWVHGSGVEYLDWHQTKLAPFVEGYGPANEMGIRARTLDYEADLLDRHEAQS